MSSLIEQSKINLNEIIGDEIAQYHNWEKRTRENLAPIFMSAAKKLETYVDNKNDICSILTKQWPKEGRRLREYLPNEYKHTEKNPRVKDDTPIDAMDEFLKLVADTMKDGGEVFGKLFEKYHKSIGIERRDFEKQLTTIFTSGGAPDLKEQTESWKKLSIDMAHAKQEEDERTKLQKFFKVLVRIQALHGTKSDVAKKARLSSKWYKNGIEMDPTIQDNFNKLVKWLFPNTATTAQEMADWFAKCLLLEKQDPDAEMPLPPTQAA